MASRKAVVIRLPSKDTVSDSSVVSPSDLEPLLVDLREAARLLNTNVYSIRLMVRRGVLPHRVIGKMAVGRFRIKLSRIWQMVCKKGVETFGAGGWNRTTMGVSPHDFESCASASSATPALRALY